MGNFKDLDIILQNHGYVRSKKEKKEETTGGVSRGEQANALMQNTVFKNTLNPDEMSRNRVNNIVENIKSTKISKAEKDAADIFSYDNQKKAKELLEKKSKIKDPEIIGGSEENPTFRVYITNDKSVDLSYNTIKSIDDYIDRKEKQKTNKYDIASGVDKMIDSLGLSDEELKSAKSYAGIKKLALASYSDGEDSLWEKILRFPAAFLAGMYDSARGLQRRIANGGRADGDYSEYLRSIEKYYEENPDVLGNIILDPDKIYELSKSDAHGDYLSGVKINNLMDTFSDTHPIINTIANAGFRSFGQMAGAAATGEMFGLGQGIGAAGNLVKGAISGTKAANTLSKIGSISPKIKNVAGSGVAAKAANAAINKINNVSVGSAAKFLNPFDNPTTLVMGTSAAQNKYDELVKMGYDKDTAAKNALFSGYVSAITEKMGYDGNPANLFVGKKGLIDGAMTASKAKNTGKILKNYLSSSISEGVEEIYNTVFERVGDSVFNTGYIDENGKLQQRKLFGDEGIIDARAIGENFLGGVIGGAVMGGAGVLSSIANMNVSEIREKADFVKKETDSMTEKLKTVLKQNELSDADIPAPPNWKKASLNEINDYYNKSVESYRKILNNVKWTEVNVPGGENISSDNIVTNIEENSQNKAAQSNNTVRYASVGASEQVHNVESELLNTKVSDKNRAEIVQTAEVLDRSLSENPTKTVSGVMKNVTWITNEAVMKFRRETGKNPDYWNLYSENLKIVSSPDSVFTTDFIRAYSDSFAKIITESTSSARQVFSDMTSDTANETQAVSDAMYDYVMTGVIPETVSDVTKFENLGSKLINIIQTAATSNAYNHNQIYGENPVLSTQVLAIENGDFSVLLGENNSQPDLSEQPLQLTKVGDFYQASGEAAQPFVEILGLTPSYKTINGTRTMLVGFPDFKLEDYASKMGYTVEMRDDGAVFVTNNGTVLNTDDQSAEAETSRYSAELAEKVKSDTNGTLYLDENGIIRFNQRSIDYENNTLRNGTYKVISNSANTQSKTVKGKIIGKYGINKSGNQYCCVLISSGLTTFQFDTMQEAEQFATYVNDVIAFNDVQYKSINGSYYLIKSEEFNAYAYDMKRIHSSKEYTKNTALTEITEGKVPFTNKAGCVEYLKSHIGKAVKVTFGNGVSEQRTVDSVSTKNLKTKKPDGRIITLELKGLSFKDTGFSVDFGDGNTLDYDFVNVTENVQGVAKTDESIIKKADSVTETPEIEYPHLYDEDKVSKDYLDSVNKEIENAILNIRNGNLDSVPDVITVTELNDDTIKEISKFVGFDISGYKCKIEKDRLVHIENRHGINGEHDQSLSDPKDTARMGYIVNNSDNIDWITDNDGNRVFDKKYNDKNNNTAPVIIVSCKIDGTYSLSQVVPDSKKKTLWITSARIEKAAVGSQVPNDNNVIPQPTPETPLNSSSASKDIISQNSENVKLTDKCELIATKHTKTGRDIWVISLKDKISADEYKDLSSKVKSVDGYYSRFAKTTDGKAIPGFIFKTKPAENVIKVFNNFFNSTEKNSGANKTDKSNEPKNSLNDETMSSDELSDDTEIVKKTMILPNQLENDIINQNTEKVGDEPDVHNGILDGESRYNNAVRESDAVSEVKEKRNIGAENRKFSENVSGENGEHVQPSETATSAAGQLDTGNNDYGIRESDSGNGDSGAGITGNDNVDVEESNTRSDKAKDFVITKAVAESIDKSSPNFNDNLQAIQTLYAVEKSGKSPTKIQQSFLAKFKGWGGLSGAFIGSNRTKLQEFISEDELRAAQSTVNDAYFTPTTIIDGVYKALAHIGFKGGNVLEPSMGIGSFFGRMPKALKNNSSLFGVEIDSISGRIAQQLYPSANINVAPFQDVAYKDGAFDLIIGNVPFGEVRNFKYKGKNYYIHDYFFVKSMDKLKDGGILAFLTSKGTLDKLDSTARTELSNKGRIIGAYRLPSDVFTKSAGANVVTDLIIMQKTSDKKGENFINLGTVTVGENEFSINEYFVNHPENILGDLISKKDWRSGKNILDVVSTGNVSEQLVKAVRKLPKDLLGDIQTVENSDDVLENSVPEQAFTLNKDGNVEYVDSITGEVKEVKGKNGKTAKDYIELKSAYQQVIDSTLNGEDEMVIEKARGALNKTYDTFVKNHGTLDSNKKVLSNDNDFYKISGLEVYDTKSKKVQKSEMFTKDTLGKRKPKKADNVLDALSISISETSSINIDRIAELSGLSESEVVRQLDNRIIFTPDGVYELNEVYLSGNVREKYNAVKGKKGFEKNEQMLKAVIPEDIPAKNITPQFGAPWIKTSYVAQFLQETLDLNKAPAVNYDPISGTWGISDDVWGDNTLMTKKYGTSSVDAIRLAEKAINMRRIVVTDREGHVIASETKAAQQKAEDIKTTFEEWCFKDTARRNDLVKTFNERFNSNRNMDFSELSKYLTFDGLSDTFKLRDYQKRAVARAVFNGNTLLAHGVGTGKTAEMITISMELKRMGIVKKNMMVVPNHKVADFRNDILKMYPSAKVAYLNKGANPVQRQKFYALVAANDFDIVIIPHSSFGMLDVSKATKTAFINNQLAELEEVLTEAQTQKGAIDRRFIRELENQKKRLEVKLKFITETEKDVGNVFEELGVDSLFVDEAHNFKNLPFYTKLSRVAGVAINQSNNKTRASRAENMFMITDYLNRNGGRITFGTATPITNSMSEIYNMLRFLRPDILSESGLKSFDAWANMFGSIVNKAEVDPTGRGMRMKERFSKFKNVSQMIEQFRRMADILKTGDVIKDLPEAERKDIYNNPNDIQEEFLDIIDRIVDNIRTNGQNSKHNMLEVTTAGQMAALDLRMVASYFDGKYSLDDLNIPNNRISQVAQNVYQEYMDSSDRKGTQFIFCDKGVHDSPDKKYGFYVYGDLINRLVALGIPRSEIAIAQEFDDKADLSARMNTGEIRVLIGSTAVMGEGMNAQNKAVALHHMTVPDRASDIEQREGRIIRYGNENKKVRIYRYIQLKSYDSYQWQMQERKAGFINQALSGGTVEELEEMSDFELSAREAKAIASGNPLLLEKIEVEDKLNNLRTLRNKFNIDKMEMQDRLAVLPSKISSLETLTANTSADVKTITDNITEDFEIIIGNTKYTERTKAAAALEKIISDIPHNGKHAKIGQYRGLDLLYTSSFDKGTHFILKGQGEYSTLGADSASGNITRIINLSNKIGDKLNDNKLLIEKYKNEIETLNSEIENEFPRIEELEQLQRKLNDIDSKLGIGDPTQDISDIFVDEGYTDDDGNTIRSSKDIAKSKTGGEQYTYKALTAKDDMPVTVLSSESVYNADGKLNRRAVIEKGIENVRSKNNPKNTDTNAFVYVRDIGRDVMVTNAGLRHGLMRKSEATAKVTLKIGDVLKNAIRVNELIPRNDTAGGYVLLGMCLDNENNYYPVRIVVNNYAVDDIEVIDSLYAINAKKGRTSPQMRQSFVENSTSLIKGSPKISIQQLLDIVKDNFSDVLSDDVLKHLGVTRAKSSLADSIRYSNDILDSERVENRWQTERIGEKRDGKNGVNVADIVKNISKKFGIPISTGKVTDRDASGIYKERSEVIRTRITNNLPTISHELGHHLDKIYELHSLSSVKELRKNISEEFLDQYKESEKDGEAIAEFVRVYLKNTNEANRLCPEFYADFISTLSREDLKSLNEIASAVNEYMSYNISERYDAAIVSSKDSEKLSFREKWHNLYTDWVDAFHPQKEAMDYVESVTGQTMSGEKNAYILATNSLNAHSVANYLVCDGFRDLNGNIVDAESFIDCIRMVNTKDAKLLDKYLVLRHSLEWIAPTEEDVTAKRVFADDTLENVEEIRKQIAEIERDHPEIKTAAENLYEYQNNVLKYFVIPAGGMTRETLAALNRKYPSYVPFYRAVGRHSGVAKGTFANQRSPIMRAKGSGALIISPLESIIRNTEKMVKFSLRNQVMQVWADYADTVEGFGQIMEKVPPDMLPHTVNISQKKEQFADALQNVVSSSDDFFAVSDLVDNIFGDAVTDFTPVANANKKIVTVLRGGRPSYYQIHDAAFYNSVAELSPKQTSGLLRIMNSIMQPMKLLITQNNPIFAGTNAIRDFGTAYKLSDINNPVTFAKQYVQALAGIISNSKEYQQYKSMGGGHSSELTANIQNISRTLRQVAQKDTGKARRLAYSIFRHPVETVATLNDAIESIPRFAEFQRTLNAGGDLQEAIYNASDITTNFRRSGRGETAKAINKTILFNNAAIQGIDKMVRTITDKSVKKRYGTLLKWLLHALIMGAIGYAYNKAVDEEGYKNLSSYKKNNFYNFAIGDGKFISLPKPRENALLDTFTERSIEYLFGNDQAFYDFGSYLSSQLLPPMLPDTLNPIDAVHSVLGGTVIGGITDIGFNQDFKGTPIEGAYDRYLPSNERYNDSTSTIAYAAGQTRLARNLDLSPKKIDHLISSYTGILGQLNSALFPMNPSRRDTSIGLRNKFISDSNYSTDVLNKMYENKDKAEQAFQHKQNIGTAIEYEQNSIITAYISEMNKAVKALPNDKQRNGRAYLLKSLNNWNYDNTSSQDKMLSRLDGETISDKYILTDLPSSKLEWTKNKVKYSYQMTPQEYTQYIEDYLKLTDTYRNFQEKKYSSNDDYMAALDKTSGEVTKELNKKYRQKYSSKAEKSAKE